MTSDRRPRGNPARPLRRDSGRTFDALVAATETLLAAKGRDVTMADIAAAAGTSTATAYRYFASTEEAFTAYYWDRLERLITRLEDCGSSTQRATHFREMCRIWVEEAILAGPAEVHIRSARGYLERVRDNDPAVSSLHAVLAPALADLIAVGVLPEQDLDYAALIWATILDERVVVDLHVVKGWGADRIADSLASSTLAALGGPTLRSFPDRIAIDERGGPMGPDNVKPPRGSTRSRVDQIEEAPE